MALSVGPRWWNKWSSNCFLSERAGFESKDDRGFFRKSKVSILAGCRTCSKKLT